jgi:mannosyltransferase
MFTRDGEVRESEVSERVSVASGVALTLVAAVTASIAVGGKSMTLDEAVSVSHAHLPLGAFLHVLTRGDPNMGLYYVMLRIWVHLFGDGAVAVRSLSVVCAVGAVVVTYLLGRRLFGELAGCVAALLLAVDPFDVQYAQDARGYSLLVLLVAASSYFLVRELERPSVVTGVGLVATASLSVYAYYFGFYVLAVDLLAVLALRRRAFFNWHWGAVTAATALLCIPGLVVGARTGPAQISWIGRPTWVYLRHMPQVLAGGSRAALLLLVALGVYGLSRSLREGWFWRWALALAWFVGPLLLSFLVSIYWQPMFRPYYLVIVLPALFLLAASAVSGVSRRPLLLVAVVVSLLAISGFGLAHWYRSPLGEDWKGAAYYVLGARRATDQVVFLPSYGSFGFDYYQRRADTQVPWPVATAGVTAVTGRIWVVLRGLPSVDSSDYALAQALAAHHYHLAVQRAFRNINVALYVPQR